MKILRKALTDASEEDVAAGELVGIDGIGVHCIFNETKSTLGWSDLCIHEIVDQTLICKLLHYELHFVSDSSAELAALLIQLETGIEFPGGAQITKQAVDICKQLHENDATAIFNSCLTKLGEGRHNGHYRTILRALVDEFLLAFIECVRGNADLLNLYILLIENDYRFYLSLLTDLGVVLDPFKDALVRGIKMRYTCGLLKASVWDASLFCGYQETLDTIRILFCSEELPETILKILMTLDFSSYGAEEFISILDLICKRDQLYALKLSEDHPMFFPALINSYALFHNTSNRKFIAISHLLLKLALSPLSVTKVLIELSKIFVPSFLCDTQTYRKIARYDPLVYDLWLMLIECDLSLGLEFLSSSKILDYIVLFDLDKPKAILFITRTLKHIAIEQDMLAIRYMSRTELLGALVEPLRMHIKVNGVIFTIYKSIEEHLAEIPAFKPLCDALIQ